MFSEWVGVAVVVASSHHHGNKAASCWYLSSVFSCRWWNEFWVGLACGADAAYLDVFGQWKCVYHLVFRLKSDLISIAALWSPFCWHCKMSLSVLVLFLAGPWKHVATHPSTDWSFIRRSLAGQGPRTRAGSHATWPTNVQLRLVLIALPVS